MEYLYIAVTKSKHAQIKAGCRAQAYRIAAEIFPNAKHIRLILVDLYAVDKFRNKSTYADTSNFSGLTEA